jgi:hypothetical protein
VRGTEGWTRISSRLQRDLTGFVRRQRGNRSLRGADGRQRALVPRCRLVLSLLAPWGGADPATSPCAAVLTAGCAPFLLFGYPLSFSWLRAVWCRRRGHRRWAGIRDIGRAGAWWSRTVTFPAELLSIGSIACGGR